MERPNILFVMTDDQTVGEMSCAGDRILSTPHMDRIAAAGTRFTDAFCTNALCAPSRATVLTGCFSHVHGIRGNSEKAGEVEAFNPDVPTFPELLQDAGYRTALVGKYHIREDPRGFDHWVVHPGQGSYHDPEFIHNGQRRRHRGYASDVTGDLALEFLESTRAGDPFCLVYQFKAPHRPFRPAPRHQHLFDDLEIPHPPTYNDDYATRRVAAASDDMRFEVSLAQDYEDLPHGLDAGARREWIYQRFRKDRYRVLTGVDENLGRVLDWLQAHGQFENTLIIYTSDHGYFLGDHGWYDKRFMYEPSVRIPLLASYPNACPGGQTHDALVMNVDYAPTILDFAGVEAPAGIQGESFRPLLEGRDMDWRQATYYAYYEDSWSLHGKGYEAMQEPYAFFTPHRIGPHRGVRTRTHKLIEYYAEGDYWELFDLEKDPHELRNVYEDVNYEEIRRRLKTELAHQRQSYNDIAQ